MDKISVLDDVDNTNNSKSIRNKSEAKFVIRDGKRHIKFNVNGKQFYCDYISNQTLFILIEEIRVPLINIIEQVDYTQFLSDDNPIDTSFLDSLFIILKVDPELIKKIMLFITKHLYYSDDKGKYLRYNEKDNDSVFFNNFDDMYTTLFLFLHLNFIKPLLSNPYIMRARDKLEISTVIK